MTGIVSICFGIALDRSVVSLLINGGSSKPGNWIKETSYVVGKAFKSHKVDRNGKKRVNVNLQAMCCNQITI